MHIGIQLPPEGDVLDFSQLTHLKYIVYSCSEEYVNGSEIADRLFDAGPSLEKVVVFGWRDQDTIVGIRTGETKGQIVRELSREEDPRTAELWNELELLWRLYPWDV